jgi:hypothetical protein
MKVAGIEIKLVITLVGGKEEIDAAISVEITGSDACSVVIIHVIEYVESGSGVKGIVKIQACSFLVQYFENRIFGVCGRGGIMAA